MTRRLKFRAGGVVALLGVAAIVAGCGSAASSTTSTSRAAATGTPSSSSAASTPSTSSAAAPAAGAGVAVKAVSGSQGTYLVGPSGRALYLWEADTAGKSTCTGACAQAWPPLTTKGAPVAAGGATSGKLGTVARSDGTRQVTYAGHPLYYFVDDSGPGMTNGQGSDAFGAKWWIVAPGGSAITSSGAASSTGSASSPAGY